MANEDKLFSRSAEAAVIGSMIIDPDCIGKVTAIVGIDTFSFPEHKILYQAVLDLREQLLLDGDGKGKIDGLLLRDKLSESGRLDEIGGVEYLKKVMDSVPSSANAEYYSNIVLEKAKRRRLVGAVESMQKTLDSDDPVGVCVSQIQQMAAGLQGAVEGNGYSQAVIKNLSDVQPLPIEWFWFNRIPLGMLTLIVGDPGLGKSFLTLYMAAKVSTGGEWPDADSVPDNYALKGVVLILSAEDDLSHVIRPRLDAMGAEPSRIIAVEGVRVKNGDNCSFSLQHDLPALQQVVSSRQDIKLVIIDPLSAYLGGGIDSHRDADVRSVLMPLVEFAERNNIAVVGVSHLNKNSTGKAVYRAIGSIAFLAAARTVWLVSNDPDNPESKRRLLTPVKHNVLVEPAGLAFEIVDGRVVFEDEPVNMTSDQALGQVSTVESPLLNKAKQWLVEQLPAGKAVTSTELAKLAQENGITESTLRRAKKELGVASYPLKDGDKRVWFIRMPEDTSDKDNEQQ